MSSPSKLILENPQYKLFKKMSLDSLEVGETALNIAKLENELSITMLESSITIIKILMPLCFILPKQLNIEVIEDGLKLIKDNKIPINNYDQQLKNIKLIIDSDGVKN